MDKKKHSPLPWSIEVDETDIDGNPTQWIIVSEGFTVAMSNIVDSEKDPKQSYANAELIVKACNNYYKPGFDYLRGSKEGD